MLVIWNFFKSLKPPTRILLVVIFLLECSTLFYAGKYAYQKYKRLNFLEQEVVTLKEAKAVSVKRIDSLIDITKSKTIIAKNKSKTIDDKLKKDEETIDNSNVSDDDINAFISEYE